MLLVSEKALLWVHEDGEINCRSDAVATGMIDYKFMCFNGEVRCAFTCTGREKGDLRVDFFDNQWKHLPFTRHYPNADHMPQAPTYLDEMLESSRILSAGLPFLRVDFYEVRQTFYLGELTLYPGCGLEEFDPAKWDLILGSWINLPIRFGRPDDCSLHASESKVIR